MSLWDSGLSTLKYLRQILGCFECYHAAECHSYWSLNLLTPCWVDYFPVDYLNHLKHAVQIFFPCDGNFVEHYLYTLKLGEVIFLLKMEMLAANV